MSVRPPLLASWRFIAWRIFIWWAVNFGTEGKADATAAKPATQAARVLMEGILKIPIISYDPYLFLRVFL